MIFSVVIPLYNKAPYIVDTVNSVLAQTFSDFEVLVIDDGSTDGGAELVESITDPRLRLIRQANSGVSAARNLGIDEANGEWIAFLDADDWHHPRYLECLLMAHHKFPSADTLGADHIKIPHAEGNWPPHWPEIDESPEVRRIEDLAKQWMDRQTLCSSSTAVRANRLKSMQPCFALGESYGEDMDLWFRLAERAPVAFVPVPLAAYRVDVEGSLTNQHPEEDVAPYLCRMRARALAGDMPLDKRKSALWLVAQQEVGMARQCLEAGKRLKGAHWLIRGRTAATGKRWWMTVTMLLLFPPGLVKSWQDWRVRRGTHAIQRPQDQA